MRNYYVAPKSPQGKIIPASSAYIARMRYREMHPEIEDIIIGTPAQIWVQEKRSLEKKMSDNP